MARKSAAALSVVARVPGKRPAPPKTLTLAQAKLWRAIVATKPADWFGPDTYPLLTGYCKAESLYSQVSAELDAMDSLELATDEGLKRYERLTVLQDRQAKLMAMLATKMRMTQQSQYQDRTAATKARHAGGEDKPWARPAS